MKRCYRCEQTKDLLEFNKDQTSKDGYGFDCKKCRSEFRKKRRKENPEHYKEMQRKNLERNREAIRSSQKKHILENRQEILAKRRKNYEENKIEITERENKRRKSPEFRQYARNYQQKLRDERKELISAWQKVSRAIKNGKMIRAGKCQICGSERKIEAHHADYTKPLEVQWLCKKCHVGIKEI
jgi:hypothetical protein